MNTSVTLKVSKRDAMRIFLDPFWLTGIINHINILQVYEENSKKYVTLDKVDKFPRRFRVSYVFGTPDTGLQTFLGYMDGPQIMHSGVKYSGASDDERFYWNLEVFLKERLEGTEIFFNMNHTYKPSFTTKLLGKEIKILKDFSFTDHILNSHVVPYFEHLGFIDDENISE